MGFLKNQKRAQAWGFDLMIASIIFLAGIILFYLYAFNTPNESENIINSLSYEGNVVSNIILSEGFPENWDGSNVISPGILTNNKINQTKLETFYNFVVGDYSRSKAALNTKYNYYVYLSENFTIGGNQVDGIGSKPLNPKNLIRIQRFTIYNNKPITFNIEIWQ